MDFHCIHMFQPSVTKGYLYAACTKDRGDSSLWFLDIEKSQLEHPYRDNIENRYRTPRINALSIQQNIISFEIEDLIVQMKLPPWYMASVGGPKFFSNNMHTQIFSTHGKSPLLQTRRTCIATHMIFSKMMICWWRSPVTWLSHNKQLIRTKIHKWHIPYHNSFLGYFPMSYVSQKTSNKFWMF